VEKNDPRTWSYEDAIANFDAFCDYFDGAARTAAHVTNNSGSSKSPNDILGPDPRLKGSGDEVKQSDIPLPPTWGGGLHDSGGVSKLGGETTTSIGGEECNQ
tara:strand:+ start:197 stop:502 length:306 start_codon:yes stop_codon:yes gene_type:complete